MIFEKMGAIIKEIREGVSKFLFELLLLFLIIAVPLTIVFFVVLAAMMLFFPHETIHTLMQGLVNLEKTTTH